MEQSKSVLYKRNFWLLVMEGTFFLGALSFFNSNTVIPVFIDEVTGSKMLVGLTLTLSSFFMYFGRLLIGPFIPKIRNHARFSSIIMFLSRPLLLLPALFIFSGHYLESVIALIVCVAIMWICDGIVVPSWSEVFANTVDNSRHGRLLGLQMLFGGVAAIGAGTLINIFLNNPDYDMIFSFGWIFLIGSILAVLSCLSMSLCRNAPQQYCNDKINILEYFRRLPEYLKLEKDYSRMMMVQFILLFAAMCTPFIILFADDALALPQSTIAFLILAQTIGMPVGGWMWGQICDRLGVHNAIKLAGFNIILVCALPLSALLFKDISPVFIFAPTLFIAGIGNGIWSCYFIYTVQVVRPESRASCLVLSSLITLPASFGGYIAGSITDAFGFVTLFIICIILATTGFIFAFRLRPIKTVTDERAL